MFSASLPLLACALQAQAPPVDTNHVPPDPPQQVMGDMTYKDMVSMMQMDDTHPFGKVMLDQLEEQADDCRYRGDTRHPVA